MAALGRRTLHGRPDVLIDTKEVGRIVLVLKRDQAIVIRAVGGAHALGAFVLQVIHIDSSGSQGAGSLPELVYPLDRFRRGRRRGPIGLDPAFEAELPK